MFFERWNKEQEMGTFQTRKGNAYFENVSFQELCANPQFIIGGATRTDVCQGELGMYSASEFCFRRKKKWSFI